MIKKIALSLFLSVCFSSPLWAVDLFEESYQDEKVRLEIEKNIKKNEVIPPEEIAKVQNQANMKRDVKIRNMRPEEAKDFVTISDYILKQANDEHQIKQNQDVKGFYKENLDLNISELVNSSPDEY